MTDACAWRALLAFILVLCLRAPAQAQGRTDVVMLANGDRITGEVVRLERGRLQFKTDDAGTLYLEWDKLTSVVAARVVEVLTSDGRRFLGTLGQAPLQQIAVITASGSAILPMSEVALITAIGRNFWRKLDGSIDAGFSYTKSSGIAQLNLNSDTMYRKPASVTRLTASFTQTTQQDGESDDDRGAIEASYLRYPWKRWFISGSGRFETNQSLGLDLRSQAGATAGPRLINNNRAQVVVGAGLVVNNERAVGGESSENVEGLLMFHGSYFTYDRPKTNVDVSLSHYPSFSNLGRHRLQVDAAVKRELLKDFFLAVNVFDSFDSRPPNPDAERNDVGVVLAIGWTS